MRRHAATIRLALILFLMCAVVCAQAASLEQFHQHSSHHCCGLCHAGMPFVQASITISVTPVLAHGWLEMPPGLQPVHEVSFAAGCCRAPPFSS
jgi:hypothetical protein